MNEECTLGTCEGSRPKKKKTAAAKAPAKAPTPVGNTLTPTPNYGISRIDQPSKKNHGWYVRLGQNKNKVSEFFSDKKNGGKTKAKAAATVRRNEIYTMLPANIQARGAKARKPRSKKAI